MSSNRHTHDAPIVTAAVGMLTLIAFPVVLFVLFTVWPESLARQLTATGGLICILFLVFIRHKFEALLLACIFFSQFAVSLHSFDLREPVKLQILFSDLIFLFLVLVAFERRIRIRFDILGGLFLLWIVWLGVATYFSVHSHRSLIFVITQIKFLVLYLLALNAPVSESLTKKLVYITASVILIQGMLAITQLLHGGWLGLSILGEPRPILSYSKETYFVKGSFRVAGTVVGSNGFSGYMAMLLVFLFPFVLSRGSLSARKWILYLSFTIGITTLLLTLSRAGWLSFIIGSSAVTFMMIRARLIKMTRLMIFSLVGGLILTCSVAIYFDKIMSRFEDKQAISSALGRIGQYEDAWKVIKRHAVIGIGPGVTEYFGRWNENIKYIKKDLKGTTMPNQVHSSQLQVWIESGTPGFLLFMAIMALIFISVFRKAKTGKVLDATTLLRIGGISAAVAVMIHTSFGTEFNTQQIFLAFWVLLGLARSRTNENENPESYIKIYDRQELKVK